ncbi:MAG: electron transfer flavoprotein subunit alpha/FixB family protein [Clostridia bacterium]|nr:electron transfer flavoprotein subunit alpha/FixB family protein [Clostridia bacterium]
MKLKDEKDRLSYKNIWVLVEFTSEGTVHSATFELLGAARKLADDSGCEVWAVSLKANRAQTSPLLISYGADTVLEIEDKRFEGFNDELECSALERLVRKYRPDILLGAATVRGRALIPRLASKLHTGLTADCTGLEIDRETGELLQTRPAFGGNIIATIRCRDFRPQMATVRPKVMKVSEPNAERTGRVISETLAADDFLKIKQIVETVAETQSTVSLGDARVIVSGGRAMKGPEGFKLLEALAERLGGAVGASRAAVDNGWIAYPHQVGQTGQTVQADVYISCGISGQIQHLVGMQSCRTIIAIDTDDTTPMMQMADIAVKGDLFEIIPEIIKELDKTGNGKGGFEA